MGRHAHFAVLILVLPAGATARAMLITAAAQWLGKDENTLPALMHRVASAKVRCRP